MNHCCFQLHGIHAGEVRVSASERHEVERKAPSDQIVVTILRFATPVDEGLGIQDAK